MRNRNQLQQTGQLPWGFRMHLVVSVSDIVPIHARAFSSLRRKSCRVSAVRIRPNEEKYPEVLNDVFACRKGRTSSESGFLSSFEFRTEPLSSGYRTRSKHPMRLRTSRRPQAPRAFQETMRVVHLLTASSVFSVKDRNVCVHRAAANDIGFRSDAARRSVWNTLLFGVRSSHGVCMIFTLAAGNHDVSIHND